MLSSLAKRMVSAGGAGDFMVTSDEFKAMGQGNKKDPNILALAILVLFMLTGFITLILFDYTFQIVKLLTIVEDLPSDYNLVPSEEGESATSDSDENVDNPKVASGLYIGGHAPDKYITSSFRKTLRYLREEAGFFSAWRGFSADVAYVICISIANGIFLSLFAFPTGKFFAGVLVVMVVSPLSLVHTHIVIAAPTKETWFGRLARTPFKSVLHTLPAMLLFAFAGQASYAFPTLLLHAFVPKAAYDDPQPPRPDTPYTAMLSPLQCFALYSVFFATHVLLFVPSMIILFRVQASVFPAHEESIIPFERRGPLNVVEAWKTYTWEGKKRLAKLYAKIMTLEWIAILLFGTVLFFLFLWAMGENSHVLDQLLKSWLRNSMNAGP